MTVRRDEYEQRYFELAEHRGWSEHQQQYIAMKIVRSLGSMASHLEIIDEVLQIEDGLRAERESETIENFERVFNKDQFQQTDQYKKAQGWDVT